MLAQCTWSAFADSLKVKNYFEERRKLQTKERLNLTGIKGVEGWLDVSTTKVVRYDHRESRV